MMSLMQLAQWATLTCTYTLSTKKGCVATSTPQHPPAEEAWTL